MIKNREAEVNITPYTPLSQLYCKNIKKPVLYFFKNLIKLIGITISR